MAGGRVSRRALPPAGRGALVGLAGAVMGIVLLLASALQSFEARTWDWRERLLARPGAESHKIVLILLDQASLDWGREENGLSWPWPREIYGAVADFCRRAGAKSVVFDVLYTEPSLYGVADDESFAAAAASNGRVVGAVFATAARAGVTAWPADARDPGLTISGLEGWKKAASPRFLAFPNASFPVPPLLKSMAVLGNTNLLADPDGVFRRGTLFTEFAGRLLPSQALAAYIAGIPAKHELAIRPGVLSIDGSQVPIDREGQAILRYRGPSQTHRTFSAAAVIQSELAIREGAAPNVDPAALKDAFVFFGFSAPGLMDLKAAPTQALYPGVEVNATTLDNLLSGDFIRPAPPALAALIILLLAMGAGTAVSAVSGAGRSALIYIAFIPVAPLLSVGAFALGMWLPLMAPTAAVVVSLVAASLASYATEGQQKRFIKNAFQRYLSPAVIEQLISHPEQLSLGGHRRELSIYFSDVQGFTTLSEMLAPDDLTSLLNEYLTAMTDIIHETGGTIDKFEGDAIIAFWNDPLTQDDHAVRSLHAALHCQARLAEMRPGLAARYGKELFMRVGLNSGPAAVGNFGSRTRFDYTMIGDQVNLAARLEGINKQFGTFVMASAATMEKSGGAFPARELSRVAVVGRKEPVTVYEPMLPEAFQARAPVLAGFGRGLAEFYAGRFREARTIFTETASVDPPSAAYAEKCRELEQSPPDAPWNGVWVMSSK